jgi:hypothetical protein
MERPGLLRSTLNYCSLRREWEGGNESVDTGEVWNGHEVATSEEELEHLHSFGFPRPKPGAI